MLEQILSKLDSKSQDFICKYLDKINIDDISLFRDSKNPINSSYNSEGLGINWKIDTKGLSVVDIEKVTFLATWLKEVFLITRFFVIGVLSKREYEEKRSILAKRFDKIIIYFDLN